MIEALERAVRIARGLPKDKQAAAARYIVALSADANAFPPATPDELASMAESIAQADRGEFATDEEIAAMWRKHGL